MKKIILILLIILSGTTSRADLEWVQKIPTNEGVTTTLQAVDSNNVFAFLDGKYEVIRVFRSSDQGDTWTKLYEYEAWDGTKFDSLTGINHCFALDTNNLLIPSNFITRTGNTTSFKVYPS